MARSFWGPAGLARSHGPLGSQQQSSGEVEGAPNLSLLSGVEKLHPGDVLVGVIAMSNSDGPSTMRVRVTFRERREGGVPEMLLSTNAEMSLSVNLKKHPHLRKVAMEKYLEKFTAGQILNFLGENGYFGKYWIKKWYSQNEDSDFTGEYFQTPHEMEDAFEKSVKLKINPYIECYEYDEKSGEWHFTGIMWSSLD